MQATIERPSPVANRKRRLPRTNLDVREFLDFMASKGFDSPAKIAREFGVAESVISRLQTTGGRTSIDFVGLLWIKYPNEARDRFLILPTGASTGVAA